MLMHTLKRKSVAYTVAGAVALASAPIVPASAALVGNDQVITAEQSKSDRATVEAFMARDDVRAQFEQLGVDPAEADARVAALSDEEVAKLADNINTAPAGQGALGIIIGAGLVIFLVLLLTDVLGYTKVFDFTEKGSANPN